MPLGITWRGDFLGLLERAGLPAIRFHNLRHTSALLMLHHGFAPTVVSERLGYAKPRTTLDIYGNRYHEKQEEAARIRDKLFTPFRVNMTEICVKNIMMGELGDPNQIYISENSSRTAPERSHQLGRGPQKPPDAGG